MTNETPTTIRPWQDEKFPNACHAARIIKTKEELLELERAVLAGDRKAQLEECADVAITLCGWWDAPEAEWPPTPYLPARPELCDVWGLIHGSTARLALMVLFRWAKSRALGDLPAAINAKMAINRARVWDIGADGTGQHRKLSACEVAQDLAADLEHQRDALARTVERVREWCEPHIREDAGSGYRAAKQVLAILDSKEG